MSESVRSEPAADGPSDVRDVMIVVGTRPEAIKLFPLIRELRGHDRMRPFVVSTGQHAELVESVLGRAGQRVDAGLRVGRPGLTLNALFASVLHGIETLLDSRRALADSGAGSYPVGCLVHGDTSSAAAAALALFHRQVPVGHVEAGLRTGATLSPFPEELNRQLIARMASFHLAPTRRNAQNLIRERVDISRIYIPGNTGIDALMWAAEQRVPYEVPELADLEEDEETRVVTVTAHRRENWGAGLESIARGVRRLATAYPEVRFVLPVHPNPAVADVLRTGLGDLPNLSLVQPMEYLPFARLLARSALVVTDSGGIQEEAPALGVPVLVTRTETERTEGLEAGTLQLVGTDPDRIVQAASRLLDNPVYHAFVASRRNPYGDGKAAERIVAALESLAFDTSPPPTFGPGFNRDRVRDWAGLGPVPGTEQEQDPVPEGLADPAGPPEEGPVAS
ncbi:UDP-N-acetylglucosamine 2-epimerase (non-hydrolyzing) [Streptomyces sp. HNM0574]|uniref:non-hydrolyzing UDP-N-acetylglucosamine 2-epimerase n=1 Tax=Streptomyces sp. HNM0574 TaxID=2714954 RepID=UPI00146C0E13|nr:UDP-N-acetylglucosamine 2-epimerase (non-hydrolyzing) [Streptomyces sp. HNM0574]NLU68821.1 UDP-N-acetylglucosamine 2-epimerase (non-hydrolyzing) [Streptomyces sp. HNM0574]